RVRGARQLSALGGDGPRRVSLPRVPWPGEGESPRQRRRGRAADRRAVRGRRPSERGRVHAREAAGRGDAGRARGGPGRAGRRARGPDEVSVRVGGSGVLAVNKAAGATSFDVVALVRRRIHVRRVGHAGTLDPAATGVLPVLIGEATKLTPYLMDQDKEYVATVRFGLTTDTHDTEGRVLSEVTVSRLERRDLEEASRPFVGRIKQIPPMYSAVHHEGRRLYELAREGIEVDREPREVVVHSITVDEVAAPRATLRVVCGKGTYVRVLAADLGAALGYGGAVECLVRCRVGPFYLADAIPWSDVVSADPAVLWSRLPPPAAPSRSARSTASIWAIVRSSGPPWLRRGGTASWPSRAPSIRTRSRCCSPSALPFRLRPSRSGSS